MKVNLGKQFPKKDCCNFCRRKGLQTDQQLRDSLARIQAQIDKSRLSREEYEKTVRLLKLMSDRPSLVS